MGGSSTRPPALIQATRHLCRRLDEHGRLHRRLPRLGARAAACLDRRHRAGAKATFFFERLLDHFFTEDDVAFMKACGATVVRLPLNYRHFESGRRAVPVP